MIFSLRPFVTTTGLLESPSSAMRCVGLTPKIPAKATSLLTRGSLLSLSQSLNVDGLTPARWEARFKVKPASWRALHIRSPRVLSGSELERTLLPESAITKLSFFLKFVVFEICWVGVNFNQSSGNHFAAHFCPAVTPTCATAHVSYLREWVWLWEWLLFTPAHLMDTSICSRSLPLPEGFCAALQMSMPVLLHRWILDMGNQVRCQF